MRNRKSRTDTERSGGERGRSKRDKGRSGREIQGRGDTGRFMVNTELQEI
jgi:hypothetical protein